MTLAYFTCLSLLPIIPQPPTQPPFLLPPHRFPLPRRPPPPPGITILPVLSAARPPLALPEAEARALMARIQDAGTEVVKVGRRGRAART